MFQTICIAYLSTVICMSVVTFLIYGWDKRQASKSGPRTPATRLHGLAFLGGWPGAILGQRFFRHKTQKLGFKLANWFVVAIHLISVAFVLSVTVV